MAKILVATDKPFAKSAVDGIKKVLDEAGFELALLEGYTSPADLINAVADVDAMIVRSDIVSKEVVEAGKNLKSKWKKIKEMVIFDEYMNLTKEQLKKVKEYSINTRNI